jgi:hypothetical protein
MINRTSAAMLMICVASPWALILAVAMTMTGCADTPVADADYGKSVQQMVEAQTYNPSAASNPPAMAPEVGDGQRIKNAIDVYRKDVAKGTETTDKEPTFDVGNGR